MNNARIEQIGEPQAVYDNPATPFVFEFLGDVNRLELTAVPNAPAEATPAAGAVTYIRPHDIELLTVAGDDTVPVVVHHIFAAGSWARVQVVGNKTGEWFDVEMSRYDLDRLQPKHGKLFYARLRRPRIFTKPVETPPVSNS